MVELACADLRFDAGAGDEAAFAVGLDHDDAEAAIAFFELGGEQRRDAFARKIGAILVP